MTHPGSSAAAAPRTPPDPQAASASSVRVVIASVAVLLLLASLDQSIVSTALPTIVADLGGLDHLSWVVTAYILASTIVAPLYGKLGDMYGRRVMVFLSVGLFLAGSALCGLATSMTWLILARGVQGLGGGGLFVLALSIVGDLIPPRERGRIQGMFAVVFGTSSVAGPLLGGWFVEQASWPWIFYINLPIGALALVGFAYGFAARSERVARKIDYAGAVTLSLGLGALVLVTSLGGRSLPWDGPEALVLIALSVAAFAAFVLIERRAAEPILPLGLFRLNTFWVTSAVGFAAGAGLFGAVTFLPLFLQIAKGASPTASGMLMIPMMAGILLASNLSGRFMRRTGRYRILLIHGTGSLTLGLALLTTITAEMPLWLFCLYLSFVGLGMGCIFPVTTTAVQNAVGREQIGVATAAGLMFRQVGGAVGVALFGAMFGAAVTARLGDVIRDAGEIGPQMLSGLDSLQRSEVVGAVVAGTHPIYVVASCIAAVGLGFSLLLKEVPLASSVPGKPTA